jgi:hypothetical protein
MFIIHLVLKTLLSLHRFWFIVRTLAAKFVISFSQSCHWSHALQVTLDYEKQRADDTQKKYSEVQEISEERRVKLEETEKKVQQLQESLQR